MSKQGFMLLELILVCSLVCLLACSSQVSFKALSAMSVRIELNKLYLLFLSLQQEACSKGENKELTFFPERGAYYIDQKTTYVLPLGVIFGRHTEKKAITFKNNRVVFYPSGHIDAGSVYICDQSKQCFYRLSSNIAQHTYVNRAYYAQNQWHDIE